MLQTVPQCVEITSICQKYNHNSVSIVHSSTLQLVCAETSGLGIADTVQRATYCAMSKHSSRPCCATSSASIWLCTKPHDLKGCIHFNIAAASSQGTDSVSYTCLPELREVSVAHMFLRPCLPHARLMQELHLNFVDNDNDMACLWSTGNVRWSLYSVCCVLLVSASHLLSRKFRWGKSIQQKGKERQSRGTAAPATKHNLWSTECTCCLPA